jgi:hypothetical protein
LFILLWAASSYLFMFILNGIFIDLLKVGEDNDAYLTAVFLGTPILSLPLPYFEIGWFLGIWQVWWGVGGAVTSIALVGLWIALEN